MGAMKTSMISIMAGSIQYWTYTDPEPDTLYKWVVKMLNSQNATVIEASLTVRTPPEPGTTTLSWDATLSNLTLSGIDFEAGDRAFIAPGFHGTVTNYVGSVANNVTETTVTPTVNHSGASYVIKPRWRDRRRRDCLARCGQQRHHGRGYGRGRRDYPDIHRNRHPCRV